MDTAEPIGIVFSIPLSGETAGETAGDISCVFAQRAPDMGVFADIGSDALDTPFVDAGLVDIHSELNIEIGPAVRQFAKA